MSQFIKPGPFTMRAHLIRDIACKPSYYFRYSDGEEVIVDNPQDYSCSCHDSKAGVFCCHLAKAFQWLEQEPRGS